MTLYRTTVPAMGILLFFTASTTWAQEPQSLADIGMEDIGSPQPVEIIAVLKCASSAWRLHQVNDDNRLEITSKI